MSLAEAQQAHLRYGAVDVGFVASRLILGTACTAELPAVLPLRLRSAALLSGMKNVLRGRV